MPVKVLAVSYINSAPLWWGLKDDPRVELVFKKPLEIAPLFGEGGFDLAIVPTHEFIKHSFLKAADLGILSGGNVRSVLLFHRGGTGGIEKIFLDPDSRTSQAMARFLFRGEGAEFIEKRKDIKELKEGEAQLLIGDDALKLSSTDMPRIDLASLWKEKTSLPAIFALWAKRDENPAFDCDELLESSLERSQECLDDVIEWSAARTAVDADTLRSYFTESLFYRMGEEGRGALEFCGKAFS